jgi:hypothetical protein
MCTDLTPDIQERFGQQILPALMAAMDDFNNPRCGLGPGAWDAATPRASPA